MREKGGGGGGGGRGVYIMVANTLVHIEGCILECKVHISFTVPLQVPARLETLLVGFRAIFEPFCYPRQTLYLFQQLRQLWEFVH